MEALLLERMREGLLQKQDNLTEWPSSNFISSICIARANGSFLTASKIATLTF